MDRLRQMAINPSAGPIPTGEGKEPPRAVVRNQAQESVFAQITGDLKSRLTRKETDSISATTPGKF